MRGLGKLLVLVFAVIYVFSPVDACPGPVDDLIVMLVGYLALKAG